MKSNLITTTVTVLMLMAFSCQNADQECIKTLQSALDAEISPEMPGILLNVRVGNGTFVWSGASGLSDKHAGTKLMPQQSFRIASVTKTFVAAAILRLWEEKQLDLDDPVGNYIAEEHLLLLKNGGYAVENITIRHLLNHSAGLSEHTTSSKYTVDFLKTRHIWTRTEQIADLVTLFQPVGTVGERYSYSDTGYVLLGEIIEKLTEKPMGDAISELLNLKGLGLTDTHMEDFNGDYSGKRIHQYYLGEDTYDFHPSLDYYGGGGLLSTTADLSLFYHQLFNGQVFHDPQTLDTMLKPVTYGEQQTTDYRMGIWKTEIEGKAAYTHTGFWGTQVVYFPEINTTVAVNYSARWQQSSNAPIVPLVVQILGDKANTDCFQ